MKDGKTDVRLETFAKSLAFNTQKGSFVKDKEIDGKLSVDFSKALNQISVVADKLEIGGDLFNIKAHFNIGKGNSLFDIDIKTKILWRNASNLLSNNISSKLNKFDLKVPLDASCVIKGDMSVKGDPEIVVNAVIKDDELKTSYEQLPIAVSTANSPIIIKTDWVLMMPILPLLSLISKENTKKFR